MRITNFYYIICFSCLFYSCSNKIPKYTELQLLEIHDTVYVTKIDSVVTGLFIDYKDTTIINYNMVNNKMSMNRKQINIPIVDSSMYRHHLKILNNPIKLELSMFDKLMIGLPYIGIGIVLCSICFLLLKGIDVKSIYNYIKQWL